MSSVTPAQGYMQSSVPKVAILADLHRSGTFLSSFRSSVYTSTDVLQALMQVSEETKKRWNEEVAQKVHIHQQRSTAAFPPYACSGPGLVLFRYKGSWSAAPSRMTGQRGWKQLHVRRCVEELSRGQVTACLSVMLHP